MKILIVRIRKVLCLHNSTSCVNLIIYSLIRLLYANFVL